jgi:VWFA-related protein
VSHSKLRLSSALGLIATLVLSVFLHAQDSSTEVPSVTIRTNTRLVMVDVVVTDKKGQPVPGLKAEDFTVEENGKRQRVAIFTGPGGAQPAPEPLPPGLISNRPEYVRPAGVPTVLLVDATNSQFQDQAYGRQQMLKYVGAQAESGNPLAVMTLTDRLRVVQEFTSDPKILAAAIRKVLPQEQPLQKGAPQGETATQSLATAVNPLSGNPLAVEGMIEFAEAQLVGFENIATGYDLERRTVITVGAMRDLARMLSGLPGRKNVVWLTSELPFDLIPQDRNVSEEELAADLPSVKQKSLGTTTAGVYASESRQLHGDEIKRAESQLASADIAIYPVDMRGLLSGVEATRSVFHGDVSSSASSRVADLQAGQGTMEEVAAETGGKAYINQNEIKDGIALAVSDATASYTLGYYPDNKKWDSRYRSIKIRVSHGDSELRYRKGYFAVEPGESKSHDYNQDVASMLALGAPATQVSFRAQAKAAGPGKAQIIFLVDAKTLSADDSGGNKKMSVTFFAALYNSNGKDLNLGSTKVERSFDAATYQQIVDHGMMVPLDIQVPAGAQELRLAVLDGKTGYIGTATGPLQ